MVSGITYCVDADVDADQRYNIVNVGLRLASPAGVGDPRTPFLYHKRLRRVRKGKS